ncbi:MAG: DUF4176 domain-containing protein [Clostridia bacterium]
MSEMNRAIGERYLPLGSIVVVKGSAKKVLIIGRAVIGTMHGESRYFDYVGCTYPEGLVGDAVLYVNHTDLDEVIQRGYEDEEEERMQRYIKEQVEQLHAKEE